VVSLSGEAAVGQRHEVASQVRLVGEAEFGSQSRTIELTPAQLGKYMLEANGATKLLGREADSVSKLPLELPPTERGELDQLCHANVTCVALNGRHSHLERIVPGGAEGVVAQPEAVNDAAQRRRGSNFTKHV